jgi:ferredoxin
MRAREIARPRRFVAVTNDGRSLTVPAGENLLRALERAGYRVMTQCGRAGQCATCRVRVREGVRKWSEKQLGPYLTPKQRQEGWVLSCQVPLENDLVLELLKPLVIRWPAFDRSRMSDAARRLRQALPGFDCEVCGHLTCDQYAQACAEGRDPLDRCLPGGEPVRERLAALARRGGSRSAPTTITR